MGRMRFVVGALGIILGFGIYQCGFFLTLSLSDSLASWITTYISWTGPEDVLGAALQLAGGAIVILGLLICISWIGSQRAALPLRVRGAAEPATQAELMVKCKFCGAVMESGVAFCPSCKRAQA